MTDKIDIQEFGNPKAMITATRKVLRPLVRLLINFRITFPQLSEILKSVYLEVADEYFRLPEKAQTDTRLSLLTGVHRKDIKRFRNQATTDQVTPSNVDISTRVITRWLGEVDYLDKNKYPIVLPMSAEEGNPSFEALVESVCKKDIRPKVVLDEWLNQGVAILDGHGYIRLNTEPFIPNKGLDKRVLFLGHNISDHLCAVTSNLIDERSNFFERCVYYDGLSDESITEIQERIADKGVKALLEINELAMQLKARDFAKSDRKNRINLGLYAYHESEDKNI